MAEKKQYLSLQLDKGSLLINEDVLETIIINAVNDVEGVAGFATRPAIDMFEVIGKKNIGKALIITIDEESQLHINCNINILYGHKIIDIANTVQNAIKNALESSANATVVSVNVNLCGIIRE